MDGTKIDATPKIQNANGGFSNSQDFSSQDSFAHAKEDICKRLSRMEARFDAQNSSSENKDSDMTVTFENEIYRGLHDTKAKVTNENGEVILKPKMGCGIIMRSSALYVEICLTILPIVSLLWISCPP